ncbi:MAG: hypothetical protein RLZZ323_1480, partial [Bacteroidota bacterium]
KEKEFCQDHTPQGLTCSVHIELILK